MKNAVYVVNKLSTYFAIPHNGKKFIFEYNKPVVIDYSKDTKILKTILSNPQLEICTEEEALKLLTVKTEKVIEKEPEGDNEESVTDDLAEEPEEIEEVEDEEVE